MSLNELGLRDCCDLPTRIDQLDLCIGLLLERGTWNVERRERSERQIQAVSSRASRSRPSNWMACSFSLYFWILPLAVVG